MGQMGDEDALGGLADLKLLSSGVLSPYRGPVPVLGMVVPPIRWRGPPQA
jgi:hypothetical protein